jgi:hypothetical protein
MSHRRTPAASSPTAPNATPRLKRLVKQLQQALRALAPKPVRTPAAVRLEALEPRLLLAGDPVATLNNGALTLALSDGADEVAITQVASSSDGGIVVDITLGALTQRFGTASAGVSSILGDGQGGNDRFALAGPIGVNITLAGGGGSDSLVGPDAGASWSLTGNGEGSVKASGSTTTTSFSGFESVKGGSGADSFSVGAAGALAGTLDGGGGADELKGPDRAATYTLSGPGAGTLGNAGDVSFIGIESLTGGNQSDRFILRSGAALPGDLAGGGGAGSDTLVGPDTNNPWTINGADSASNCCPRAASAAASTAAWTAGPCRRWTRSTSACAAAPSAWTWRWPAPPAWPSSAASTPSRAAPAALTPWPGRVNRVTR